MNLKERKKALIKKEPSPYILILAKSELKNADKIQNLIKNNFFIGGPTLFLGFSSLQEVETFIKYLKCRKQGAPIGLALLKNSKNAYLLEEVLEKKNFLGDTMISFFALSVRRNLFVLQNFLFLFLIKFIQLTKR